MHHKMPKIGVGVITLGKRPLQNYKILPDTSFKVFQDIDRKGASHGRNFLMKEFYEEGCDYWFIFDDDCYPTIQEWELYFIRQAVYGNWDFFGMPEFFKDPIIGTDGGEVAYFERCLVQFAMYSRKLIETVGYYRKFTHAYGFEDTEYVYRILHAQRQGTLNNNIEGYPCPVRVMAYIHPDDVFGNNPTPYLNLSAEEKEQGVKANIKEYQESLEDVHEGRLFWSYEEAQGAS